MKFKKIFSAFLNFFNFVKEKNRNRKRLKKKKISKKNIKFEIENLEKKVLAQNISNFYSNENYFSKLCEYYGTDKGYIKFDKKTPYGWKPHSYSFFYNNLFSHCRDNIKLVFECGIGTNYPDVKSNMTSTGKPGASLKVWKDYFKNAKIFGADIDKRILFQEERINTYEVNQLDPSSIKKMWSNIDVNNFDLIIDDGLHTYEAAMTLFRNSFDRLKKDGIYIIEDVHFIYLNKLKENLIKYNPEVIILKNDYVENHPISDNNLIVIRKI